MQPGAKAGTGSRTGMIVALVVAVATGVTTAVTMSLVEGEQAKSTETSAPAAVSSRELQELRAAIDELRQSIARLELTDSPAESAAAPAALGPGEMASHGDVAALSEAVRQLVERLNATIPRPITLQRDTAKREVMRGWANSKQPEAPREHHFLWTEAQVLDAYGPPDTAKMHDGGVLWSYYFDDGSEVQVLFGEGRVVDFDSRPMQVK